MRECESNFSSGARRMHNAILVERILEGVGGDDVIVYRAALTCRSWSAALTALVRQRRERADRAMTKALRWAYEMVALDALDVFDAHVACTTSKRRVFPFQPAELACAIAEDRKLRVGNWHRQLIESTQHLDGVTVTRIKPCLCGTTAIDRNTSCTAPGNELTRLIVAAATLANLKNRQIALWRAASSSPDNILLYYSRILHDDWRNVPNVGTNASSVSWRHNERWNYPLRHSDAARWRHGSQIRQSNQRETNRALCHLATIRRYGVERILRRHSTLIDDDAQREALVRRVTQATTAADDDAIETTTSS